MSRAEFATCPHCRRRVKIDLVDAHGVWLARHRGPRKLRNICPGSTSPIPPDPERAHDAAWTEWAESQRVLEGGVA